MKNELSKRILILIAVFMLSAFCLGATEIKLQDAITMAINKSPAVKSAELACERAQNDAKVKNWLPTFSLSGSVSDSADLTSSPWDSLKEPTITFSTGAKWNLSLKDFVQESADQLNLENALLSYESTKCSVSKSVISAYCNLIESENSIANAQLSLENARTAYERTLEMYEASKASELALLQAKLACEDSLISLNNAKVNYENKMVDFKILIGFPQNEVLVLEELSVPDDMNFSKLEEIAQKYVDSTSAVLSAEIAIRLAELSQKNNSINSTYPSVSLNTSITFNEERNARTNKKFDDSLNVSGTFAVSVPLDVYLPWTSSHATYKNEQIEVENAKLSLEKAKEDIQSNVRACINQILQYKDQKENLINHLNLTKENFNLVSQAYEAGYASYSELNTARISLENAGKSVSDNKSRIISQLGSFASILELDFNAVLEYLK